ncbi:MAG: antitoxin VapB family protein [Candidatus Bathyarchaeota archaeon]
MTKVISLSEDAYKALKRLKRRGESFSDVVMKMAKNAEPKSLLEFAGGWTGNDIKEVFEKIHSEREATTAREYRI